MFDDEKAKRKNRPARSWAQIAIVALAAVLVIGTLIIQATRTTSAPAPTATPTRAPRQAQSAPTFTPTARSAAVGTVTPVNPSLAVAVDLVASYNTGFTGGVAWLPTDAPHNAGKLAAAQASTLAIYNPESPNGSPLDFHLAESGSKVTFNAAGTLAALPSSDNILLADPYTGSEVALLVGHTDSVNAVAFSPDGKLLASAGSDSTLRLWRIDTAANSFQQIAVVPHPNTVSSVAFSPDGVFVATGCWDHRLRLWSTQDLLAGQVDHPQVDQALHQNLVTAVTFSPDGQSVASGGADGVIFLYYIRGLNFTRLGAHTDTVNALSFSPDGRLLASAGNDNVVRIWDVSNGVQVAALPQQPGNMRDVAFSPDGHWLAAVDDRYTVTLWAVRVK